MSSNHRTYTHYVAVPVMLPGQESQLNELAKYGWSVVPGIAFSAPSVSATQNAPASQNVVLSSEPYVLMQKLCTDETARQDLRAALARLARIETETHD